MNAIKTLAIIAVLAAAGVGLYVNFNTQPPEPPPGFTDNLDYVGDEIAAPQIEMSSESTSGMPPVDAAVAPPLASPPPLSGAASPDPPIATDPTAPPPPFGAANPVATPPAFATPAAQPGVASTTPIVNTGPTAGTGLLTTSGTFATARRAAQELLDRGDLAAAHLLLSPWYGNVTLLPNEASELSDLLGQLAGTVIYSRQHRLAPAHRVQLGETLESIAGVYQVPWQLLAKINGLPSPANVTVGQELKVIQGPFSAVVSTERRELVVLVGGRYAGRFAVGIGRDAQVVEGEWSVNQKQINPAYNGPSGTIAADDPTNPLGEHLIGLSAPSAAGASSSFGVQSIGIHGTHDPSSIQADDPRGFVRLAPRDAEDVYDILTIGSKVTIRR